MKYFKDALNEHTNSGDKNEVFFLSPPHSIVRVKCLVGILNQVEYNLEQRKFKTHSKYLKMTYCKY